MSSSSPTQSPGFSAPETSSATVRLLLAITIFFLSVFLFGKPQVATITPAHPAPASTIFEPN